MRPEPVQHPEVAPQNVTREPRRPHMEVMNLQTGDVWLCQAPITFEEFKAFEVAAPLMKSGCTTAAFDAAYFLRAPEAGADGALETTVFGGREFSRVARPVRFSALRPDAPTLVQVQKHHVMTFEAGREVTLARLPDGRHYVQQTEPRPGKTFSVPADWTLIKRTLQRPWTVYVPPPVDVWFFASLASFQGPLAPEQLAATI